MPQTPHVEKHFTASESVRDNAFNVFAQVPIHYLSYAGTGPKILVHQRHPIALLHNTSWQNRSSMTRCQEDNIHQLTNDRVVVVSVPPLSWSLISSPVLIRNQSSPRPPLSESTSPLSSWTVLALSRLARLLMRVA